MSTENKKRLLIEQLVFYPDTVSRDNDEGQAPQPTALPGTSLSL